MIQSIYSEHGLFGWNGLFLGCCVHHICPIDIVLKDKIIDKYEIN